MVKRVNVKAQVAIKSVTPPIYGTLNNVRMSTSDILKCLCKRAIVDEILSDGRIIRLGMKNYYMDNEAIYVKKNHEETKPSEDIKKIIKPDVDIDAPINLVSEVDLEDAADAVPVVVSEPNIVDKTTNNAVLHEYSEEESAVEGETTEDEIEESEEDVTGDDVEESEDEETTEEVEEEVDESMYEESTVEVEQSTINTQTNTNNHYNYNKKKKKHR